MQRRHGKTWLIVLLAGLATYSLAGFLLAPVAIKHWVENSIVTEPGCRLRVQRVYANPFTLFLSLSNVTLFEQENKIISSLGRVETHVWSVEKFQAKTPGHDLDIRNVVVANASNGEAILTSPKLSATGFAANARGGLLTVDTMQIEEPVLHVVRDVAGTLQLPGWLPMPSREPHTACVSLDALRIMGGQGRFTDHAQSPALRLDTTNVVGSMVRLRESGGVSMTVEFAGRFGESGSVAVAAQWPTSDWLAPTTLDVTLRHFELSLLSPYFVKTAGRGIVAGVGDVTLHYEHRDSTVQIENRIAVAGLRLADRAATDDDMALPLDLALALVMDKADRIDISIPVLKSGVTVRPDAIRTIVDSLTDYIRDLAAMPFDVLANFVGQPDENLGSLSFSPGSAEITPTTTDKITLLARALDQRPLLGVRARPVYDPVADRDAIAAQQVRLHVALATSAGPKDRAARSLPNFDDPKVRAILDEFAGARLAESQRIAISSRRPDQDAHYYRIVYDALVANESVSETTLRRLARFRATSVINALAANDVGKQRLLVADAIDTTTTGAEPISVQLELVY